MFLNVGYDCEWMWSQCFYRCVSLSIFPLCIFVGARDCLIAKGFLFAENLKIRCNQKQHRTCKHEKVEYAMHVSFVHSEHGRSEKAGHKPCKEHETGGSGYAYRREVRREECRKHKRADDERRDDGHVAEDVEFPKAERKDDDCDGNRHSECDVAVYLVI